MAWRKVSRCCPGDFGPWRDASSPPASGSCFSCFPATPAPGPAPGSWPKGTSCFFDCHREFLGLGSRSTLDGGQCTSFHQSTMPQASTTSVSLAGYSPPSLQPMSTVSITNRKLHVDSHPLPIHRAFDGRPQVWDCGPCSQLSPRRLRLWQSTLLPSARKWLVVVERGAPPVKVTAVFHTQVLSLLPAQRSFWDSAATGRHSGTASYGTWVAQTTPSSATSQELALAIVNPQPALAQFTE